MTTRSSAPTTANATSHLELLGGTQVSGCQVCPTLTPVQDGSNEPSCGRCAQIEELLHLVAELLEEMVRLGSIRELEEIDWWGRALPSLN